MIVDTPFQPQDTIASSNELELRASAFACLKMLYPGDVLPPIVELLTEASRHRTETVNLGWVLEILPQIAKEHTLDITGAIYEEKKIDPIVDLLENREPVIVLIEKGFKPSGKLHTIVVIGVTDNSRVVYHDPLVGENQEIPVEDFLRGWQGKLLSRSTVSSKIA